MELTRAQRWGDQVHVDVVPAECDGWITPHYAPRPPSRDLATKSTREPGDPVNPRGVVVFCVVVTQRSNT